MERMKNSLRLATTFLGATLFYGALAEVMRPNEPHPGLRDDALKAALRKDRTHETLSYVKARDALFNGVDGDGKHATCAYTGVKLEFLRQPVPTQAAVEHAWPMTRLPAEARSDLHHMMPVEPEARVARLNLHYGKVFLPVWSAGGSRSGPSKKVKPVFEVRKPYRGDVARAMFYVATMYDLQLDATEEEELRKWHEQDPVSSAEKSRNERVAKKQKSKNPFIEHPALVKRIRDF